jgi:LysM repeat protein
MSEKTIFRTCHEIVSQQPDYFRKIDERGLWIALTGQEMSEQRAISLQKSRRSQISRSNSGAILLLSAFISVHPRLSGFLQWSIDQSCQKGIGPLYFLTTARRDCLLLRGEAQMPTITVSQKVPICSSQPLLAHVRRCLLVMGMALSILMMPALASNTFAQEDTIHIVRAGESLSAIAGRYGVSVSTLARYNQISNINIIRVGQVIRIPGATLAPAATPIPQQIVPISTVPSSAVGQPTRTPVPTPHVYDPDHPTATSTPVIPTPVPTPNRTHTVNANETLSSIASRYSTTVWAIKTRNGIVGDRIYRGQRLIIP